MKIKKAAFINPAENTLYASFAISVSFFIFAYSTIFGKLPILVLYGLWFPLILMNHTFVLHRLVRSPLVLGFCVLACLSFFWSDAPKTSMRGGLQLATHILCAFVAARVVGVKSLCFGSIAGVFVVLVYSLAFGRSIYDPVDGSYAFAGAFASKNQLGFFASLGVFFCLFYGIFIARFLSLRVFAVLLAAFYGGVLLASGSATSILSLMGALCLMLVLAALQAFSRKERTFLFFTGIMIGLGGVTVAFQMNVAELILGAFGKDSTLTGRTYLWNEGLRAGAMAPVLGVGYQAYWVQGFAEAERLWQEFYISTRTGFHFHNTYIEAFVELGYVGAGLIVFVFTSTIYLTIRALLGARHEREPMLLLCISSLLVVRSFFEVDAMNPYVIGSFLLYYCAARIREWPLRHTIPQSPQTAPQQGTSLQGAAS